MNQEILMVAESVSNEKDLPKDTIFEAILGEKWIFLRPSFYALLGCGSTGKL